MICFCQPQISIRDGRHPCIANVDSFVPNDTFIGDEEHPSILLLTGPNMGGKSTLMRQVALITVMAQIVSTSLNNHILILYSAPFQVQHWKITNVILILFLSTYSFDGLYVFIICTYLL